MGKQANYSAQEAVKAFLGKPAVVRIHLDLCAQAGAAANGIKLKSLQNQKTIAWSSESRSAYLPPADQSRRVAIFGERKDLTMSIETPGGDRVQHLFPLAALM